MCKFAVNNNTKQYIEKLQVSKWPDELCYVEAEQIPKEGTLAATSWGKQ